MAFDDIAASTKQGERIGSLNQRDTIGIDAEFGEPRRVEMAGGTARAILTHPQDRAIRRHGAQRQQ